MRCGVYENERLRVRIWSVAAETRANANDVREKSWRKEQIVIARQVRANANKIPGLLPLQREKIR